MGRGDASGAGPLSSPVTALQESTDLSRPEQAKISSPLPPGEGWVRVRLSPWARHHPQSIRIETTNQGWFGTLRPHPQPPYGHLPPAGKADQKLSPSPPARKSATA